MGESPNRLSRSPSIYGLAGGVLACRRECPGDWYVSLTNRGWPRQTVKVRTRLAAAQEIASQEYLHEILSTVVFHVPGPGAQLRNRRQWAIGRSPGRRWSDSRKLRGQLGRHSKYRRHSKPGRRP